MTTLAPPPQRVGRYRRYYRYCSVDSVDISTVLLSPGGSVMDGSLDLQSATAGLLPEPDQEQEQEQDHSSATEGPDTPGTVTGVSGQ